MRVISVWRRAITTVREAIEQNHLKELGLGEFLFEIERESASETMSDAVLKVREFLASTYSDETRIESTIFYEKGRINFIKIMVIMTFNDFYSLSDNELDWEAKKFFEKKDTSFGTLKYYKL